MGALETNDVLIVEYEVYIINSEGGCLWYNETIIDKRKTNLNNEDKIIDLSYY